MCDLCKNILPFAYSTPLKKSPMQSNVCCSWTHVHFDFWWRNHFYFYLSLFRRFFCLHFSPHFSWVNSSSSTSHLGWKDVEVEPHLFLLCHNTNIRVMVSDIYWRWGLVVRHGENMARLKRRVVSRTYMLWLVEQYLLCRMGFLLLPRTHLVDVSKCFTYYWRFEGCEISTSQAMWLCERWPASQMTFEQDRYQ